METEWIKLKHYIRLNSAQPYFVWNDKPTVEDFDEADSSEAFWDLHASIFDDEPTNVIDNVSQVHAKAYKFVDAEFTKWLEKNYKGIRVVASKKLESAIEETKELMEDDSVNTIVNPVFQYKNAIAQPKAFVKDEKKLLIAKYSGSLKGGDLLIARWAYMITSMNTTVENVHTVNFRSRYYKPFQLEFKEREMINCVKSGRTASTSPYTSAYQLIQSEREVDILDLNGIFREVDDAKNGKGLKKNGKPHEEYTLTELVGPNLTEKLTKRQLTGYYIMNEFSFDTTEEELDSVIEKIMSAKNDELENLSFVDNQPFAKNKFYKNILEEWMPFLVDLSGNIMNTKDMIKYLDEVGDDVANSKSKFKAYFYEQNLQFSFARDKWFYEFFMNEYKDKAYLNIYSPKWDKELFKAMKDMKNEKVVWYDFEGVSLPFPFLEGFLPYGQVANQVSIIKTDGNIIDESSVNNLVCDPVGFDHVAMKKIIDAIYDPEAKRYIVFNKSYENTRLKEMLVYIGLKDMKNFDEYQEKVNHIFNHTIDLAELFAAHRNKSPMIQVNQLMGKHSIKLIEKFITNSSYENVRMIKSYKSLDIQNGLMAMEEATKRLLGVTGDKQWTGEIVPKLQEYCENDVRAMIMVYDFVLELIKEWELEQATRKA